MAKRNKSAVTADDRALGASIRTICQARGMSQDALAAAVAVSQSMIAQIERGAIPLRAPLFLKIARALNAGLHEFTGGDGTVPIMSQDDARLIGRINSLDDPLHREVVRVQAHNHIDVIKEFISKRRARA